MNLSNLLQIWMTAASSDLQRRDAGVVCVRFQKCKESVQTKTESGGAAAGGAGGRQVAERKPVVAVNECSPAFKLLQSIAVRKAAENALKRAGSGSGSSSSPDSATGSPPRPSAAGANINININISSTCSECWHAKQVHALSKWLARRKYRYVYSDWERRGTAGELCWSRSQHGHFTAYESRSIRKYQCLLDGSSLLLPVTIERRQYANSLRGADLSCAQTQQRRVYKCGPHMTLHVATRCGKWYRLWIELEQRPEAAVTTAEYEKYLQLFRQLHRFLSR
jgi:hypothetical protein